MTLRTTGQVHKLLQETEFVLELNEIFISVQSIPFLCWTHAGANRKRLNRLALRVSVIWYQAAV